jgi:PAS domain S-box-containing protein
MDAPSQANVDLSGTALVVADRSGRVSYWSEGATTLFGYSAAEMIGRAVSVLVPAAFRRRHIAGWRAAWATGKLDPSGAVMIPVVCADGEVRTFASHILPLRDPHGELLAVCAVWSPPSDHDAALRLIG